MTARARITAVAVCGAAFAIAGCGHKQGSPIPASQAGNMIARLNEAIRRSNAHACHDLSVDTIPALQQQVAALPASVDSNIRATLSDGVNHLSDLVQQQCSQQTTTTPTTPTQTTPTVPTQTVPTQTTPTQTTPTQTQTTPTNTTPTQTTPTNTTTTTNTSPGGGTPVPGTGGVGPNGTGPPGQKKKAGG